MSNAPPEALSCVACGANPIANPGQCCDKCIDELRQAFEEDEKPTEPRIITAVRIVG